jgi:hypothetical protein
MERGQSKVSLIHINREQCRGCMGAPRSFQQCGVINAGAKKADVQDRLNLIRRTCRQLAMVCCVKEK